MPTQKQITTEIVRSLFKNNFKLCNYAIKMAQFYVSSGHEVTASSLIKEVSKHPEESYLDTLIELEREDQEQQHQYDEGQG